MYRRRLSFISLLLICACTCPLLVAQTARRPLKLDDMSRFRNISDPQVSPDGKWVAYTVSTTDVKGDKSSSHIWMIGIDGSNDRQITFSQDSSESSPRWSPDGKYLSFTSSRPGKARGNQVWLLDRNGGEAMQLTELKGRLQGHEWSPDSKRLALVIGDPDPDADPNPSPQPGATPRVPKPIVIDRYRFKQDGQGYLLAGRHTYIYLFDVASRKLDRLTKSKSSSRTPRPAQRKNSSHKQPHAPDVHVRNGVRMENGSRFSKATSESTAHTAWTASRSFRRMEAAHQLVSKRPRISTAAFFHHVSARMANRSIFW
jgi:dipeptidyl aminopeptidase/acylaminoacyl peptidase